MPASKAERKYNLQQAVSIYDRMYREQTGRPFMNPAAVREMIDFGRGKHISNFTRLVEFLESFRDERQGADDLKNILPDYYSILFKYYKRFNRIPTIKQIFGTNLESEFRTYVYMRENEEGAYFTSQRTLDRIAFSNKWDCWGHKIYDPFLPHLWNGPGDPSKVPELNKGTLPINLGFRELVKYRLIKATQEDIDEYNRLWVEDEEANRWLDGGKPTLELPGPPKRVKQESTHDSRAKQYGITRGTITIGAPSTPPRRVPERAPSQVPRRTPAAGAKQAGVPRRVTTQAPSRVERK